MHRRHGSQLPKTRRPSRLDAAAIEHHHLKPLPNTTLRLVDLRDRISADMDQSTKISDLKHLVRIFCEVRDWDQYHSPKELAIGVVTEAGELLDKFRFLSDRQITQLLESEKRKEIEHEVADVLFFLLRFAQRFNIDLDDALRAKLEINARKYPIEKARGNNLKSTEY